MKRSRMSRRSNRRNFKRGNRVNKRNFKTSVNSRGGIRL